ncbi:22103_t:CDS:2, partial [Gigaspora rosea]
TNIHSTEKILVHIKSINFNPQRRLNPYVKQSIRLMIGLTTYVTKPSTSLEDQLKKSFLFPLSYHSLFFDSIKFTIYEYGSFLNVKKKYGRVIVRLNTLKQAIIDQEEFEGIFPIETRFPHLHEIGTIKINIKFNFSNDPALTSRVQSKMDPFIHDGFDCNECVNIELHPEAISLGIFNTVLNQETGDSIKEIM